MDDYSGSSEDQNADRNVDRGDCGDEVSDEAECSIGN
jgi:hypothetical protein